MSHISVIMSTWSIPEQTETTDKLQVRKQAHLEKTFTVDILSFSKFKCITSFALINLITWSGQHPAMFIFWLNIISINQHSVDCWWGPFHAEIWFVAPLREPGVRGHAWLIRLVLRNNSGMLSFKHMTHRKCLYSNGHWAVTESEGFFGFKKVFLITQPFSCLLA